MEALCVVFWAFVFVISIVRKLGGSASRFVMIASLIIAGISVLGVVIMALLLFVDMLSTVV